MISDQTKYLYRNDPVFRRMVDTMAAALRARQTTVSMISDAAEMANDLVQQGTVRCPFALNDVVQLFEPTHPQHEQLGIIDHIHTGMIDQIDLRFTDNSVSRVSVMSVVRPWIGND